MSPEGKRESIVDPEKHFSWLKKKEKCMCNTSLIDINFHWNFLKENEISKIDFYNFGLKLKKKSLSFLYKKCKKMVNGAINIWKISSKLFKSNIYRQKKKTLFNFRYKNFFILITDFFLKICLVKYFQAFLHFGIVHSGIFNHVAHG